jgi:hypothetical protein
MPSQDPFLSRLQNKNLRDRLMDNKKKINLVDDPVPFG